MVGRISQVKEMNRLLREKKSHFIAVTGRRRVGKTYLIENVYKEKICISITGIQNGSMQEQLTNFTYKIIEKSRIPLATFPTNWQEVFLLLKQYLQQLSTKKKQVIFIDELPWIATPRSGFLQMLAHLWNDYLSKAGNYELVICGSASSWIRQKILNDKGGLHNRVSQVINLLPFTLSETKAFLYSKKIKWKNAAIAEIYMAMGGIPFYLENIKKGESPTLAIERLCFTENGLLHGEYNNLYKALFDYPENHEAIVKTLANATMGLTRSQILTKTKIQSGGPYTRAMNDLLSSGFITEEIPFGRKKRGSIYRLSDEYSVFYHKFIVKNKKLTEGMWSQLSSSQAYKIWTGYAFESLCHKHINALKSALKISNIFTESSSFSYLGTKQNKGFQIDMILDRKDNIINLCECKFYSSPFIVTKANAKILEERKQLFNKVSKTKKTVFTTLITANGVIKNKHFDQVIDSHITLEDLYAV